METIIASLAMGLHEIALGMAAIAGSILMLAIVIVARRF